MTEELKDKELSDIKYLRARMTGNVGLALDHAYNLGFFEGEKNVAEKILNYLNSREKVSDDEWLSFEIKELQKFIQIYLKEYKAESNLPLCEDVIHGDFMGVMDKEQIL